MSTESLTGALKRIFGLSQLRPGQEEVISHLMGGGSGLLLMPTGGGKSLCFQLPSQLLPGMTLVFSPLIALMKDQVDALRAKGVSAAFINSALSRKEREQSYRDLAKEKIKLLYVTPERFRQQEFCEALVKNQLSLLAVDEAHCISQWGHDFRPDYSRLGEIRQKLGRPPTLAVTATATPEVCKDILSQLYLGEDAKKWVTGVERDNLAVSVHHVFGLEDKIRSLVGLRHYISGPCVVYFSLISTLEHFASELSRLNRPFRKYHGQLPDGLRRKNQEGFLSSKDGLMLATPAFGLGVDKSDIRLIVHVELPGSLEAYYQEIGRAGRDGQVAEAHLLFDQEDISIQSDFIKWTTPDPGFIQAVDSLLRERPDDVKAEGINYLRGKMNFYNSRDFRVETTLNLLERWGLLQWTHCSLKDYKMMGEIPKEMVDKELHAQRLKSLQVGLLNMVQYAQSKDCRMALIYKHFGLQECEPCGRCDNCQRN